MSGSTWRIATRASALALWQARHVAALLAPYGDVELVTLSTEGDRRTDVPLSEIGGKGVFVKEVQAAVMDGRADLAVHSAKDLPAGTPPGLVIAALPERGDPRDALVGSTLAGLPRGGVVATGSARRRVQLAAVRPDLRFEELRGNIDTRLAKAEGFDAIVMAAAALDRLGRTPAVVDVLPAGVMVPQVAQGALAVECRDEAGPLRDALGHLDHPATRLAVTAERAFLTRLGGDCDLPAGAHAVVGPSELTLTGVLSPSEGALLRVVAHGDDPGVLGTEVAERLLAGDGR